ncbi:MAG: mechanosensitive ion channel domain-containing protein [Desulfuromonadales bacterium]
MISKNINILIMLAVFFVVVISNLPETFAEETKSDTVASAKEVAAASDSLENSLSKIAEQRAAIDLLKKRLDTSEGISRQILQKRLEETTLKWLDLGKNYVREVAGLQDSAPEMARYREDAKNILREQLEVANSTIRGLRSRAKMPTLELPAIELASAYIDLLETQESVNQTYGILVDDIELARKFEIDTSQMEASLKGNIEDLAVSRSILLEVLLQNVRALKESTAISPDDKELKTKLTVSNKYLSQLADKFTPVLGMMDGLAIETSSYREQIVNSTGTISADVAEINVVKDLLVGWGKTFWDALIQDGPDLIFKLLLFLLVLYIANKLSKLFKKIVEKSIERSHLQLSELLRRMVVSVVRNIILIIGFLIGLSQIGISLGPLLAGFGIIGFVVGFALQDSLSNFAAGMMILIYRPYDVGDLIEACGMTGRVSHMSIVNTTIITFDNQTIVVPNNKIWGDVIKNVTAQTIRRVDMVFGISYSDDVAKAEQVLQNILETHEKVLTEPEPMVRLHELGDSSVNFIVRPWVKKEDYWDVYWDITRTVKIVFDQEGLSIPFPQRDVHLYRTTSPELTAAD